MTTPISPTVHFGPLSKSEYDFDLLKQWVETVITYPNLGQGDAVSDASGGTTIDTEARAAINDLLAELRTLKIIDT